MKQNYFGIQTTFIIGVVLSVAIIKYAIGFNNFMVLFWDVRSIIIVLGGVLAATHMHFTDAQFFKFFSRLIVAFSIKAKHNLVQDIDYIVYISTTIQSKGVTSILSDIENCKNPFLP